MGETTDGTPASGSNFYLGFLFLPKRKREALSAVYGFCRTVDDIVDSGRHGEEEARRLLDFWREEVDRLYDGRPTDELARRLEPFVSEFHLPKEGFVELVRGVRMDLERSRYETMEELEKYMFGVAGAVGLLVVAICGYSRTSAEDIRSYAVTMGNAVQLTNILRDVGTDLEQGRIYLPQADMREAGLSVEAFCRREHSPAFVELMGREYERAKGYYRKARGHLHPEDRAAMLPAEVMARIYEAVLERIKEAQYRVFFHRVRLPLWRKALLASRAWLSVKCRD